MAMIKTKRQHEGDRTEILRFLNEAGFLPVPPHMILVHLDERYRSVSDEGVDYALRFLQGKGWVEIGEEKILGKPRRIMWAKITPAGVDELDRRTPEESGVRE
jgi:repressor of nif and glnA expression